MNDVLKTALAAGGVPRLQLKGLDAPGNSAASAALVMDDTVMSQNILTVQLRRKRDVVLARHHARQIAGLFGFENFDRAALAAAVFELAWKSYHSDTRHPVVFSLEAGCLVVTVAAGLRLQKALPARGAGMAPEDVPWAIQELVQLDPRSLFEEAHQQNQEMLATLQDLARRQAAERLPVLAEEKPSSAA